MLAAIALLAACAPATQPSPTTAPAKPADKAAPAASPAAKAEGQPAASPASQAEAKPAAKVDTKAIEDFYKGKTVRIIVGYAAGGGFDTYARLVARHMGKYIPGTPNIIVENQEGAGSLIAANQVYNQGAKDGTVIAHYHGNLVVQQALGNPAVQFDAAKYQWLGAPTPDTSACAVTRESGFASLEQARTRELVLGGEAPGSSTSDIANVLKAALGLNIKLVPGYQGTSKIRLAAEQGEVHGGCWGWSSLKPTWQDAIEKNQVVILAQGGREPHPDLKDVPLMSSLAQTEEQKQLISAGITIPAEIARGFAVPPGVPAERVQVLRDAFMSALKDKDLLAEAEKSKVEINAISAETHSKNVQEMLSLPQDVKAKLKTVLSAG
jgi:tripartite-type tricarboxylate transporter receptor subunit TctC